MTTDASGITDEVSVALGRGAAPEDGAGAEGFGVAELRGPDGEIKQTVRFRNIITDVGDTMYADRGAGVAGAPASPTGMALGTGTTAAAKNGAGAAMVTGTAGTAAALGGTPTSSTTGGKRRVVYTQTWGAGVGTATLNEVVLQNGTATTIPPNTTVTNVVARAILSPAVSKGASDTLTITWNHDIGT